VDGSNELFDRTGLFFKEFRSDYSQVRFYSLVLVQKAPPNVREHNLLEQQISEIIKNAVKHGNRCDANKMIKVWYRFTDNRVRLIVEDEGTGFREIERWNEFNTRRNACIEDGDFGTLATYVSFRSAQSDVHDGGNALFAALEYWNEGVIYTESRNCVAVSRKIVYGLPGVPVNAQ